MTKTKEKKSKGTLAPGVYTNEITPEQAKRLSQMYDALPDWQQDEVSRAATYFRNRGMLDHVAFLQAMIEEGGVDKNWATAH